MAAAGALGANARPLTGLLLDRFAAAVAAGDRPRVLALAATLDGVNPTSGLGSLPSLPDWATPPPAQAAVPGLLDLACGVAPRGLWNVQREEWSGVRTLADRLRPNWRHDPAAARLVPPLLAALASRPDDPDGIGYQRAYRAREVLLWCGWRMNRDREASPLAPAVVRGVAARLDAPPPPGLSDRGREIWRNQNQDTARFLLDAGPPKDALPALVRCVARGERPDSDTYRLGERFTRTDPGWKNSAAAAGAMALWEKRITVPTTAYDAYQAVWELESLGPGLAGAPPVLVRALANPDLAFIAARALAKYDADAARAAVPVLRAQVVRPGTHPETAASVAAELDRIDPGWARHPTVAAGLDALRARRAAAQPGSNEADTLDRVIRRIEQSRAGPR